MLIDEFAGATLQKYVDIDLLYECLYVEFSGRNSTRLQSVYSIECLAYVSTTARLRCCRRSCVEWLYMPMIL